MIRQQLINTLMSDFLWWFGNASTWETVQAYYNELSILSDEQLNNRSVSAATNVL